MTACLSAQEEVVPLKVLESHFEYNRNSPIRLHEASVADRGEVAVHDLSYGSPVGGTVPAYLVVPKQHGPFAVVLYGHWMMHGSPLMNRKEFLEEAVLLAKSGAISLLIDSPLVRPGFAEEKDPLRGAAQASEASRQQVIDFRRGIDWLAARNDVDAHRIAYVGHSFDAHVGAILSAIEKRIQTFVLMAGSYADQQNTFSGSDPAILAIRKRIGDDRIQQYFHDYVWDDPVHFLPYSTPSSIFLQFGSRDHPKEQDLAAFARFGEPKRMKFYDAGHALNMDATKERIAWLQKRLRLSSIDPTSVQRLPQLR